MKKLIAMIGAVATAFGLYAADPTLATTFETGDAGVDGTTLTLGTGDGASGWTGLEEATLELGTYSGDAYTYGTPTANTRRETFDAKGDNAQFLKLETGTKTISHAIGAKVIDQLVKFTGFEEAQTNFVEGTKIAVWMSGIETEGTAQIGTAQIGTPAQGVEGEDGYVSASPDYQPASPDYQPASSDYVAGETNLYVTVGDGAKAINVQIDPTSIGLTEFKPDTWYRLTIKSIGNVIADNKGVEYTQDGFLVYIDGKQVAMVEEPTWHINSSAFKASAAKSYADKQLFTAIAKGTAETIATLGFAGIGAADDIIADDDGPEFCQSVAITEDALNEIFPGAKAVEVTQNGDVIPLEAGVYTVKPGNTIVVTYDPNGPYVIKGNGTATYNVALDGVLALVEDESDIEVVEAAVMITPAEGEVRYYDADDAVEALSTDTLPVNDGDTVKFLQEITVWYTLAGAEVEQKLFYFTPNTTIAVNAITEDDKIVGSKWDVLVAGYTPEGEESAYSGELVYNDNINAGKVITVTLADDSTFTFGGAQIAGNLTVVGDDSVFTLNPTTLVGDGKVTAGYAMTADAFVNASEVEVIDNKDGTYTAQIKQATGFAIIIAGGTTTYYDTLEKAIEAYTGAGAVTLMADAEIPAFISITKDVTIDLNGFTLARADDADKLKSLFEISNEATLTVDGTVTGSAANGRLASVGKQITVGNGSNGKLIVNGGTYTAGATQTAIHVNGDCDACEVTINDATIVSMGDNGVQFNGKGTFAINNSSITGATAIYMKAGTLTIDEDSVITATAATWTAPAENHNGSNPTGDAIVMDSITGYKGEISLTVADGAQVTSVAGATIRETITAGADSTTVKIDAPSITGIALTPQFIAMVAAGTAQLPGYVAAIGTVPYQTLQAAITDAGAKATVTLIANTEENVEIAVGKELTLDLNGKTLTGVSSTYVINNKGTLTITGNGTVNSKVTNLNTLVCNARGGYGTMKIENGTFISDRIAVKNDEDGNGICGTLTINGGTFTGSQEESAVLWDSIQNWGNATINGGTFNGYIECRADTSCNAGVMTINDGIFNSPIQTVVVFNKDLTPATNAADVALTINGGTFNDKVMRVVDLKVYGAGDKNYKVDFDENVPDFVATCETLGTITIVGEVEEGVLNDAQFMYDESIFCEKGFETVKGDADEYYSVAQSAPEPVVDNTEAQVVINETTTVTNLHDALVVGSAKGAVVTLLKDVDLAGKNWEPVSGFKGTFDGKGFIISNLTITAESGDGIGLIAGAGSDYSDDTVGAQIRNVTFENVSINAPNSQYVGTVGGSNMYKGLITNVTVCGTIQIIGKKWVGGIVGHGQYGSVIGCHVDGGAESFITGSSSSVGGIYGMQGEGFGHGVYNCLVKNITISGSGNVGAIVGRIHHGVSVVNCDAENCVLKSDSTALGTIVGDIQTGNDVSFIIDTSATDCELQKLDGTPLTDNPYGNLDAQRCAVGTNVEGNLVPGGNFALTAGTFTLHGDAMYFTWIDDNGKTQEGGFKFQVANGYAPVANEDGTYTITAVYGITFAEIANGKVETSVTNNIVAGTEVTVTVTADAGFKVKSVKAGELDITEALSFTMPANDVVITAEFEADGPTDDDGGEIEKDQEGNYVVTPAQDATEVDIKNLPPNFEGKVIVPATVATIKGVPTANLEIKVGNVVVQNTVFVGGNPTDGFSTALSETGYAMVNEEKIMVKPEIAATDNDGPTDTAPLAVATDVAVGVKSIPGLTYTLKRTGELGTVFTALTTDGASTVATGARVELKDVAKPAGKAFYVIGVEIK